MGWLAHRGVDQRRRAALRRLEAWAAERFPRGEEPERAWQSSIRAKALDLLRGLLPASTLSHVGIFASGQAYEQLLLRLMASPLPEARQFGGMILDELNKVVARQQQQLEWLAQEMRSVTERMQDGVKPGGAQHEIPPHY